MAVRVEPGWAPELLEELSRELAAIYGDDGSQRFETARYFLVAYQGSQAVGCGALVDYEPGTLEVKRMYVAPSARGQGVGRLLLQGLEDWARAQGIARLILETGDLQPEGQGLYRRAGFRTIEAYGPFVSNPHSLCFEKTLT